jgi:hypothetical protein
MTRFEMLLVTIAVAVLVFTYMRSADLSIRLRLPAAIIVSSVVASALDIAFAQATGIDNLRNQASYLYWYEFSSNHSTPFNVQGISVTMFEYLLRYHTITQLLSIEARGFSFLFENMNALFFPYPIWNQTGSVDFYILLKTYLYPSYPFLVALPAMAFLAILGLLNALRYDRARLVLVPLLVPAAGYVFLYGIYNVADTPIRLIAQFIPILFIAVGALLAALARQLQLWTRFRLAPTFESSSTPCSTE